MIAAAHQARRHHGAGARRTATGASPPCKRFVITASHPRGPVPAQDAESGAAPGDRDSGTLEEVVVTAQKRETNLQDTPISVAVLTAEGLDNWQAISLARIGQSH